MGEWPDLRTARLVLHPVDVAEAERIAAGTPGADDQWVEDYPFDGDRAALGGFLRASAAGEQRPFGYYRIDRIEDGRAVGGIGFKGRPVAGAVEIGYGLAPSARGTGLAAEAAAALVALAGRHGVTRVRADTDPDNVASQRTLLQAGFRLVAPDADLWHYEMDPGEIDPAPHPR